MPMKMMERAGNMTPLFIALLVAVVFLRLVRRFRR